MPKTLHNLIASLKNLWDIISLKEVEEEIDEEVCELCEGTGKVEKMSYECNDSTGYNTIVEGTGEYYNCPECNQDDGDSDE